jgi:hypothetical protein
VPIHSFSRYFDAGTVSAADYIVDQSSPHLDLHQEVLSLTALTIQYPLLANSKLDCLPKIPITEDS